MYVTRPIHNRPKSILYYSTPLVVPGDRHRSPRPINRCSDRHFDQWIFVLEKPIRRLRQHRACDYERVPQISVEGHRVRQFSRHLCFIPTHATHARKRMRRLHVP